MECPEWTGCMLYEIFDEGEPCMHYVDEECKVNDPEHLQWCSDVLAEMRKGR